MGNRETAISLACVWLALTAAGGDFGFGPGHASSFCVGKNEKAFVVCVSGLTWPDLAQRDYRGQGYQDADKKNQRFHCLTDARIMDVEKKSDCGTVHNWCGRCSQMQALLWRGCIQGCANEDAVADYLRQAGDDEAVQSALRPTPVYSVVTVSSCVIRNADCAVSSFGKSSVTLTGCTIEG